MVVVPFSGHRGGHHPVVVLFSGRWLAPLSSVWEVVRADFTHGDMYRSREPPNVHHTLRHGSLHKFVTADTHYPPHMLPIGRFVSVRRCVDRVRHCTFLLPPKKNESHLLGTSSVPVEPIWVLQSAGTRRSLQATWPQL